MRCLRPFLCLIACAVLAACAPTRMTVGPAAMAPVLTQTGAGLAARMEDGAWLPVRVFKADNPRAVILALHGFNDYSNAFAAPGPGPWFAAQGIALYAYDQRGFGRAPGHGYWAGGKAMVRDATTMVRLLRTRHPGLPVYVMGASMGGAVAMNLAARPDAPEIDGLILAAPAVWGWRSMNLLYRSALWTAAHVAPDRRLSGQGLGIMPSDNIEMLRGLGRDPLVIKETRIATVYGLVGLMDDAYRLAPKISVPVLYLYGANDELVPRPPTAHAVRALAANGAALALRCVERGWHMLLRDKEREAVWKDILSWIKAPGRAASSNEAMRKSCGLL
ncbi:alpha-beta hydrolase superfamily lysophospholipase [Parvibaculum indicum]|uniref:alpha/beta hydrolase n=1 Tax=Parvibaculum indicum TaxID=562969 RepID=UPI001FE6C571|nr:alpha/beta hydrolase [Parvibaculum indicum]NIJ42026.1 alpha-beta hydrolase superfamily lysophospholipase [Parvibaculum indicum]